MRNLTPILIICLLVSCSSSPKAEYPKLGLEIPAEWGAETDQAGFVTDGWWQAFRDEHLNKVIEDVLKHNYTLKIAAANIQATAAQARIAGADIYPSLSGSLSRSRYRQNYIGFPLPGAAKDEVFSTRTDIYGSSLNLSWELDLWGRIRSGKDAAVAGLEAARADYLGARLSLIAQTAKVWFSTIEIQKQLELAQASLDNHKETVKWTRSRYQMGVSSSTDLRLALSNLAVAENTASQWQEQKDRILRQLEILMGKYPAADLTVAGELVSIEDEVPAGLPAELISRRPDLVSAERQLASASKSVAQAKAGLYPSLSLTGSDGRSSPEFNGLLKGNFRVWNIVGNLLQPIFQGGKIRAGIKQARSSRDQALASFANVVLNAYAEVENALKAEEFMANREKQAAFIVEQARAIYETTRQRYHLGVVNALGLLEIQRSYLDVQARLMTVQRQRLDARIDLYLALGGGFERGLIRKKSLISETTQNQ